MGVLNVGVLLWKEESRQGVGRAEGLGGGRGEGGGDVEGGVGGGLLLGRPVSVILATTSTPSFPPGL